MRANCGQRMLMRSFVCKLLLAFAFIGIFMSCRDIGSNRHSEEPKEEGGAWTLDLHRIGVKLLLGDIESGKATEAVFSMNGKFFSEDSNKLFGEASVIFPDESYAMLVVHEDIVTTQYENSYLELDLTSSQTVTINGESMNYSLALRQFTLPSIEAGILPTSSVGRALVSLGVFGEGADYYIGILATIEGPGWGWGPEGPIRVKPRYPPTYLRSLGIWSLVAMLAWWIAAEIIEWEASIELEYPGGSGGPPCKSGAANLKVLHRDVTAWGCRRSMNQALAVAELVCQGTASSCTGNCIKSSLSCSPSLAVQTWSQKTYVIACNTTLTFICPCFCQ